MISSYSNLWHTHIKKPNNFVTIHHASLNQLLLGQNKIHMKKKKSSQWSLHIA